MELTNANFTAGNSQTPQIPSNYPTAKLDGLDN